jgi:hypothetical protein
LETNSHQIGVTSSKVQSAVNKQKSGVGNGGFFGYFCRHNPKLICEFTFFIFTCALTKTPLTGLHPSQYGFIRSYMGFEVVSKAYTLGSLESIFVLSILLNISKLLSK